MVLICRARWLLENALTVIEFGSLAAAKIAVKLDASLSALSPETEKFHGL